MLCPIQSTATADTWLRTSPRNRATIIGLSLRLIRSIDGSSGIGCAETPGSRTLPSERSRMKFTLAAVALITATGSLNSQERFDMKVRSYFFAGFAGDAASLERGMKLCEDALAADPKDSQALVWHGSGVFFQAGEAFRNRDSQKGMELWQRGLKEMRDAVAMAPEALGVVIPRGAVLLTASHYVPPEMARQLIETGVQDFEKAYQLQG